MNAFMTGSRYYGTPKKKSDLDLVVLMDPAEFPEFAAVATDQASKIKGKADDYGQKDDDEIKKGKGGGELNLLFGKLNLIVFTDPAKFEAWRIGNKILKSEAPVTRDRAIEVLELLRKAVG